MKTLTKELRIFLLNDLSLDSQVKSVIARTPIGSPVDSLPTSAISAAGRFVPKNDDQSSTDRSDSNLGQFNDWSDQSFNGLRGDPDSTVDFHPVDRDIKDPETNESFNPYDQWIEDQNNGLFGGLFDGLSNMFGGLGIGSLIKSLIGKYTDATVTGGEVIRNQWDLDKMSISNQFSVQQAELSRDWQEEMYEKYNSLSGKINQAREAGVNPMFAVTGNAVSPMSTNSGAPSGTAVTGSGQKSASDLLSSIASLIGLKAQIRKTNAETQQIETNTDISLQKLGAELSNLESSTKLNLQKVIESATSIEKIKSDINLNEYHAELFAEQVQYLIAQANYINAIREPEKRLKVAQATISEWQEKNKELFKGLEIGSNVLDLIGQIGLGIFNAKTGRMFTNSPVVVPKDGQVFFPSDIVR